MSEITVIISGLWY